MGLSLIHPTKIKGNRLKVNSITTIFKKNIRYQKKRNSRRKIKAEDKILTNPISKTEVNKIHSRNDHFN